MGQSARFDGLSLVQLHRLAACERRQEECEGSVLTRAEVADILELELTAAGRFVREMCAKGLIACVYRPEKRAKRGECSQYQMSPEWRLMATELRARGVLPDRCAACGCEEIALPLRYREAYWCRHHLMTLGCDRCVRRDEDGRCMRTAKGDGDDGDA